MGKTNLEKVDTTQCPVLKAVDVIKGRWALPIINDLMEGKKRFKELERSLSGVNTRMLVKELKLLELEGIVQRQAFATVPPTVEYTLTEKGVALKQVINELRNWSLNFNTEHNTR